MGYILVREVYIANNRNDASETSGNLTKLVHIARNKRCVGTGLHQLLIKFKRTQLLLSPTN